CARAAVLRFTEKTVTTWARTEQTYLSGPQVRVLCGSYKNSSRSLAPNRGGKDWGKKLKEEVQRTEAERVWKFARFPVGLFTGGHLRFADPGCEQTFRELAAPIIAMAQRPDDAEMH